MARVRFRTALILLLLCGLWFRISEFTDADITDEVTILNNRISMTTLSLSSRQTAHGGKLVNLLHTSGLVPSGFDVGAIRVTAEDTSSPMAYRVYARAVGDGDDTLCQSLHLDLYKQNEVVYRGDLMDLSTESSLTVNGRDDWIIIVSLLSSDAGLKNNTCNFDFVFSTKKEEQQGGLYAQSKVGNIVTTGTW